MVFFSFSRVVLPEQINRKWKQHRVNTATNTTPNIPNTKNVTGISINIFIFIYLYIYIYIYLITFNSDLVDSYIIQVDNKTSHNIDIQ